MSGRGDPDWLLLDEQQQMLRKTAESFVERKAPVARLRRFRDDRSGGGGFARELWQEMAALGWLGLQIPESYGGAGLGFFDLCVLLEATGRELMPEPFASTLLLGAQMLLLGGTDEQKAALLPGVVTGDTLLAVGYGERDRVGSGIYEPNTFAQETPDGFILRGEKAQVLDAHLANRLIVSVRTADAPAGVARLSIFIVDPNDPRVAIERQHRIDEQNCAIVRLNDVFVGREGLVGELHEGARLLECVLDRARVGLAAHMLGASERAFERTLGYLKEREQFGAPIGSFQALQHRASRLFIEIALTRSTVVAAARAIDKSSDELDALASMAKATASETFMRVAKEAIQMHGGIGVTDEHDIGFYIKRAQATYVSFGDPSFHRRRWAALHGY